MVKHSFNSQIAIFVSTKFRLNSLLPALHCMCFSNHAYALVGEILWRVACPRKQQIYYIVPHENYPPEEMQLTDKQ